MTIDGKSVLITAANRGIGRALVDQALTRARPGIGAIALKDGVMHHIYAAYGAGSTRSAACGSGSTARHSGERQNLVESLRRLSD